MKKKPKKRPYTEEEKREVARIVSEGFRGRPIDISRAEELYRTSPEEYEEIGSRVRAGIRESIMRGGG